MSIVSLIPYFLVSLIANVVAAVVLLVAAVGPLVELLAGAGNVTPVLLVALGGALLSLGLDKLPFLAAWFDGLDSDRKRAVVLGGTFGVAVALFVSACLGQSYAGVSCTGTSAFDLVLAALGSLLSALGTHAFPKFLGRRRETAIVLPLSDADGGEGKG